MHYSAHMSEVLSQIGVRLRARRLDWELTQAELARRAGVSPRFLVQLEKGEGNISVGRLAEVCDALSFPLAELFRGIGPGRPDKVALVGLRGAGKSTVGARLAEATEAKFIELDALVEEEAGMSLSEIFEMRGEAHYRAVERQVLERVLRESGPVVIAAGGSIVTAPDTWKRLQEGARTVWLQASPGSHLERVRAQGDLRPMQGRPNAHAELEAILDERSGLYAEADVHLDTDGLGIDGVVQALAHD
jgi:XRE family aerobic/anaerobic benzoate catabolism transcriptional regulator